MHEVLVNRLGGLSLPRKSVVRLTDRPDMTLDVYSGRKKTMQQLNNRADNCYANKIKSSYLCSIFKPSLSYTPLSLYPKHKVDKMARVYLFSSKGIPSVVIYEYRIK